jgi:hypothetical protein
MAYKLFSGLVITCMLTMSSCKPKSTEQIGSKAAEIELFKSVYDTLNQMEIPITLTWKKWDDLYKKHIEKYGLRAGENTIDHPFAKFTEGKNFKAFLFVSTDETGSPVIVTFGRNGNRIDGLGLLGDIASNDPSNWTKELSIINKDLTIQLIDSVWNYSIDSNGGRIESSGKLTIKEESYRILDSGKFKKVR